MVVGLFVNIIKERVSFAKILESGWTLNRIEGKGGAFGQISPFFSLLSSRRTGGAARRRRPGPASQGTAAAGARGERERGPRGIDPP